MPKPPVTRMIAGIAVQLFLQAQLAMGGQACPSDLNGDGAIDAADLALLLGAWGSCCGDGLIGSGEECDPPDGVTCDDGCQLIGPCGQPGLGSCCSFTGVPGCEDASCCLLVCAADPFCCEVRWDNVCAGQAASLCGICLPNGDPCALDSECESLHCVDATCCGEEACGFCQSCAVPGFEGACSPIPAGQDPDEECPGATVCGAGGGCAAPLGYPCTSGPHCLSSSCVDGVCCESADCGFCQNCAVPGSEGACSFIPDGSDPDDECPGAAACNGAGACR